MKYEDWLYLMEPELKSIYNKMKKIEPEKPKWFYEKIYNDVHVVTIDPLELKLFVKPHQGLNFNKKNFINASFTWWEDYPSNQRPYPTSMLIYNGDIFNNAQPNGYWIGGYAGQGVPTPTFIIYKTGICSMEIVNDLSYDAFAIHLAVTIVQTNPIISKQGYVPYVSWNSIDYRTNRIGIFYRAVDHKVLLIYASNTNIQDFHEIGKALHADFGGCLDSGGSANFKVNGENINTTSRWMSAGIYWE